jgi:small-conductance mechanosensitive channel
MTLHCIRARLAAGAAFLAFVLALAALAPPPAHAQGRTPAPPAAPASASGSEKPELPSVDALRERFEAIPTKIGEDDDYRQWLSDISAIGTAATQVAARRAEALADVDTRLSGLGPAPDKGATAEAPDVAQQRSALAKERSSIDAELKLARLIAVDAEQRGADIIRQRREQFQTALTTRIDSPLTGSFWRNVRSAFPGDLARLQSLGTELRQAAARAWEPAHRTGFVVSMAMALFVAIAGPWLAERLLLRLAPARLPPGRLRRSLLAFASVLVHTMLLALAVQLAWGGLTVEASPSPRLQAFERATLQLAVFAAFMIALGHALISRKRSSWRLTALSDELATRLAPYPWWLALTTVLGGLVIEVNRVVGASLSAEVSAHAVSALLMALVILCALRHLRAPAATPSAGVGQEGQDGSNASEPASQAPAPRPIWMGLLVAGAAATAIAILVLLVLGFVALAHMLAGQMVWTGVVFATTYLLFELVEDVAQAVLSSRGGFGQRLHKGLGIDGKLLDQSAVVASGALRVVLLFYMVIALLAPLGTAPDEVFRRGGSVNQTLQVGSVTLAPQALLTALAIACAGFVMIRILKRWLSDQFFPNTSLEPGMRSSIVTLLGYVGGVAVIAIALAGLGISVERIAWVASALSVGIGFGLQAIVQNFISGLILLAERPVRVGDWVVLGETEGDVRRVNVRATEIQLGDRSTVIVPNSEFITKTVRNMTLTGAPGRVLLRLPAPLDTDAQRMRTLILEAFTAHEGIMDDPEPIVQLEGILNGTLTFLAIGYVSNPRNAGGVRSDLLFSILDKLRDAGLALSPPATTAVAHSARAQGGDTPLAPVAPG